MKKRSHSNLEGQTFNHWFVLKREQDVGYIKFYKCRCKCGNIRSVRSGHLVSGNSKSCGCVHKPRKHGQARGINTPNNFPKKYRTWRSIKSRCCNPEDKYYYGLLCDEWQDYVNFDRDVPDPPSDDLTIDRIDNDKGYIPGNVRWITWTEQHRNQRNCRWIEYGGKKKLISHWARLLGMAPTTLNQRIRRHGIPKALLLKVNSQPQGLRSFNRSEVDNPKSLLTRDQVKEIYIYLLYLTVNWLRNSRFLRQPFTM